VQILIFARKKKREREREKRDRERERKEREKKKRKVFFSISQEKMAVDWLVIKLTLEKCMSIMQVEAISMRTFNRCV